MAFGRRRFKSKKQASVVLGYRSGLEERVQQELVSAGISYQYEPFKLPYTVPESKHTYTPDIVLSNGIIIELKGRLLTADRKKMKLVKEQHPELDIRFIFSTPNAKLSKGSKTTFAMWAEKNGFPWAQKSIPAEWSKEPKQSLNLFED